MFCDQTKIKLGETLVEITRLTIAEIKNARKIFAEGDITLDEEYTKLIADHCTVDGKKVDATLLSFPQLVKLTKELAGVPEGGPLSDFIGLLS